MNDPNLKLIVDTIKEALNPEKIILFGSRARGDNREDSDYDIAVIKDTSPHSGEKANISYLLYEKGLTWPKEPDIHLFSQDKYQERLKKNSLFIREIQKGIILYAR